MKSKFFVIIKTKQKKKSHTIYANNLYLWVHPIIRTNALIFFINEII